MFETNLENRLNVCCVVVDDEMSSEREEASSQEVIRGGKDKSRVFDCVSYNIQKTSQFSNFQRICTVFLLLLLLFNSFLIHFDLSREIVSDFLPLRDSTSLLLLRSPGQTHHFSDCVCVSLCWKFIVSIFQSGASSIVLLAEDSSSNTIFDSKARNNFRFFNRVIFRAHKNSDVASRISPSSTACHTRSDFH